MKNEARASMNNEQWSLVAVGIAHLAWEEGDEAEYERRVDMSERALDGQLTDEEWAELEEWHAEMSEAYEDEAWFELD